MSVNVGHYEIQDGRHRPPHNDCRHRPPHNDCRHRPPHNDCRHRPPHNDCRHRPPHNDCHHEFQCSSGYTEANKCELLISHFPRDTLSHLTMIQCSRVAICLPANGRHHLPPSTQKNVTSSTLINTLPLGPINPLS